MTKFQMNGVDVHGSVRELDQQFNEHNPWLSVWENFMSISQFSPGFLVSWNEKDRAKFLAKLLGYDKFLEVNGVLTTKLREAKRTTKDMDSAVISSSALLQEVEAKVKGLSVDNLKSDLEKSEVELQKKQKELEEKSKLMDQEKAYETQKATVASIKQSQVSVKDRLEKAKLNITISPELFDEASRITELGEEAKQKVQEGKALAQIVEKLKQETELGECSRCGQPLSSKDHIEAEIAQAQSDLDAFRKAYTEKNYPSQQDLEAASKTLSDYGQQQNEFESAKSAYDSLPSIPDELPTTGVSSEEYRQEVNTLTQCLTDIKLNRQKIESQLKDFDEVNKKEKLLAEAEMNLQNSLTKQGILKEAVDSTATDGKLTTSFLSVAASVLSDGEVSVTTSSESKSTFEVKLLVDGLGEIPYDMLSGGQRAKVDLILISRLAKLVNGIPLLVLDETLKFLSGEAAIEIIDELRTSSIGHIILVSHGSEIPQVDNVITPPSF